MLSLAEQNAVKSPEYILTKNTVLQKVATMFGDLSTAYIDLHNKLNTPKNFLQLHPKISKGENYLGLPYIMLDYPRIFEKDHVFAIRSFFWWGHYFSITLHVKGRYKKLIPLKKLADSGTKWMYYMGNDEWENRLKEDNILLINPVNMDILEKQFQENTFCKVLQKFDLCEWDHSKELFIQAYKDLLQFIDSIHQYGE